MTLSPAATFEKAGDPIASGMCRGPGNNLMKMSAIENECHLAVF